MDMNDLFLFDREPNIHLVSFYFEYSSQLHSTTNLIGLYKSHLVDI